MVLLMTLTIEEANSLVAPKKIRWGWLWMDSEDVVENTHFSKQHFNFGEETLCLQPTACNI